MKDTTGVVGHYIELAIGAATLIGLMWTAFRFLLQPAYKIAKLEERAKLDKESIEAAERTAHIYRGQLDALVKSNALLTEQVRVQTLLVDEQIKRADMALLSLAERMSWERRGRQGTAPEIPPQLETALYELVASRLKHDGEVPGQGPPFSVPPEEGAK